MLVIENSEYGDRVPIQLGTLHIDMILEKATPEQLVQLGKPYKHGEVGRPVQSKGMIELERVSGPIKLTKDVTLEAEETIKVNGLSQLKGNVKRLHVVAEPIRDKGGSEIPQVVTIPTYSVCIPGSQKVTVMLRNVTNDVITLRKGRIIAELAAANLVPNKIAPQFIKDNRDMKLVKSGQLQVGKGKRIKTLMEKLDLSGMGTWTEECQGKANQTMMDFKDIFALKPLELGKTNLVKHSIKVNNLIPFKERYQKIPPHQFKEVRKHLKEMEVIGAIRRSNSPWASLVVLVRKKDGSLRFCINLRKLNARTIKDAYSLPRIEESLDCFNGAYIFSSLDLKSGYWQVELDNDSIPMTAFTVGPLGFYECVRMPFGLMNAPATFQRLMESCLGELHLNWCIIYLDDIIIHSRTPEEHIIWLRGVFKRLRTAGLKLKPSKCTFFKDRIAY